MKYFVELEIEIPGIELVKLYPYGPTGGIIDDHGDKRYSEDLEDESGYGVDL